MEKNEKEGKGNTNKICPYGYIYQAINSKTRKPYVGQTVSGRWGENQEPVEARWNEECTEAERKYKNQDTLREVEEAIIKYGRENFKLEEIDTAENQKELDDKETYWIKELDSMENGYNANEGGSHGRWSEAARARLEDKWQEDEYRTKQEKERRERGKNPKWREKMREVGKDLAKDPKWRKKVSEAGTKKWQENDYRTRQEEERRQRAKDVEWVNKMTNINRAKARSQDWINKMKDIGEKLANDPHWRQKLKDVGEKHTKKPSWGEKVSRAGLEKWNEKEYVKKQLKERENIKKKIDDKAQFFHDIKEMSKKDINQKYNMDGKTTNRRIKEMLGHQGITNYTQAREYLHDKDLDSVLKDVNKNKDQRLKERVERRSKLKNKEQFLRDIKEMAKKDINHKYGITGKTTNNKIRQMLGHRGIKKYTEARQYLQDKNVKDVVKDINKSRERNLKERAERRGRFKDKEQFLKDIKEMKRKDIDHKYGVTGQTTNKRIREMLGHQGVKNYTQAREYLQDKNVKDVAKEIAKNKDKRVNEMTEKREKLQNKDQFLKDIKEMKRKDIDYKYGISKKSTNKKIREMLGHEGVNNYTQAREYLKDKNVKDVAKDIKENKPNQEREHLKERNVKDASKEKEAPQVQETNRSSQGFKKIEDKKQFLKDIKGMMKKEIDKKYEMSKKTTNRRIKEMLGHRGVNNYSQAKAFLKDKNVDNIVKDIDSNTESQQDRKSKSSELPKKKERREEKKVPEEPSPQKREEKSINENEHENGIEKKRESEDKKVSEDGDIPQKKGETIKDPSQEKRRAKWAYK